MGQKINPISNRLGYIRGWDSNWYGGRKYGDKLLEDSRLRRYLSVRLAKASVSRIVIERALKHVTITICTARPGIVIGKGGQDVDTLKEELKKITNKEIKESVDQVAAAWHAAADNSGVLKADPLSMDTQKLEEYQKIMEDLNAKQTELFNKCGIQH